MIFLLTCAFRALVILVVALIVTRLLFRQSAALRHCVLTAGILFAGLTPVLGLIMPAWNIPLAVQTQGFLSPENPNPVREPEAIEIPSMALSRQHAETAAPPTIKSPAPSNPTTTVEQTARFNFRAQIPWRWIVSALPLIWIAGVLLTLSTLIAGMVRLTRFALGAHDVSQGVWADEVRRVAARYGLSRCPQILQSNDPSLLVTWGWRRPRILLPMGSEDWPVERVRAVLCHELAHVWRGDWLVQVFAELLRVIYWFNPFVWVTCKSLRCESEQASDDAALGCGFADSEYAEHLLDVVRSLRQPRRGWSYALSMAQPSTLERRFKAILNPSVNRNALTRFPMFLTLVMFLAIALPISMVRGAAVPVPPPGPSMNTMLNTIRSIAAVMSPGPTAAVEPQQPVALQSGAETDGGIIQGMVRRADLTAPIVEAQITLEGGPADPKAVQALIQTIATRGVIFNPKRIGTVDEVLRDFSDQSGAQGQGPGFPVFDEAVAAFRATNAARYVAESDMDGHFTVKGVPPGDYIIHVEREGFFDLAARAGNPTKVTVQARQSVNATVSLTPGGVVSGHVRNALGDPQQNVGVQVFAMAYQNGYPVLRGAVQKLTDDHGAYRLFWLAPGDYYIAVNPGGTPDAAATQRTMYPGTFDIARATPVSVRAGEQVTGIDIQLPTDVLPRISGKVTSTIPAEETARQAALYNEAAARPTLMLIGRDPSKPDIGSGTARTIGTVTLNGGTGTFEVPGILPGSYDLYLRIPQSNAQGGAGFSFAKVPIDVKNENVTGISITVNHTVNVTGSVTIDGKAPGSTPIRLQLQPDGSGVKLGVYQSVGQRIITPDGNGAFTSVGVPPGLFRMDVGPGLPADLYLADVRQGGISVFDSGIEVTSEKPNPLQVVLNSGAGTIEGTALDANGKPQAGAYVVLAPLMMRRQNRALYHTATADANGKFSIHSIAPGTYQLFAWQQAIPAGAYYNAGFLRMYENRSRAVNVVGKAKTTEQISVVPLQ